MHLFTSFLVLTLLLLFANSQDVSYCTGYSASKTNSAISYYCTCNVIICPGESLSIDGCSKCEGYQYFRLYNSVGIQVTSSGEYNSSCSPCGEIKMYTPQLSSCERFSIRQGCFLQNTCSGKLRLKIYNTTVNATTTAQVLSFSHSNIEKLNSVSVDLQEPRILRASGRKSSSSSSSSNTSGYCNRDTGLSIGGIIAAVLVPLLCCGFCFALIFQLVQRQHSTEKVHPGGNYAGLYVNGVNPGNGYPVGGEVAMIPQNNVNYAIPVTTVMATPVYPSHQQQAMYHAAPTATSTATATPVAVPVYHI